MKIKKEYMILFGLIVVLLVYLIFGSGRNKMSYRVPKLEKIEKGEIDKIEITKADVKITLSSKGENWKIMPQEFPADHDKVTDMLEVIESLTLTELAAEKKDYNRYELDKDKKITVKAYRNDELLREFDIGKPSSTYRHTFVRVDEDTRIYHALNSFRSTFDQESKELRDKVVMKFNKNEIIDVEIFDKGTVYQFSKKMTPVEVKPEAQEGKEEPKPPAEEETWLMQDGKKGNKSEIDSILMQLSNLRCDEFIEGKKKEDFEEPLFKVNLKEAKDYSLQIFTKEDKENGRYPAVSSENAYPFLLTTYTAENIMKKPEDLTKEE